MKLITTDRLDALRDLAAASPRLRSNDNIHTGLDDPVQRFLNALEPGTYVRPHRHSAPPKWELFIILAGRAAVLLFDDNGRLGTRVELNAQGPIRGAEIPAGAWHSVVALVAGTVLFELKPGPYQPVAETDFAPWAPPAHHPEIRHYVERLAILAGEEDTSSVLLAQ